ncbi:MAG: hypothetical protein ACLQLO_01500 [Mycobacterium sp.]
MIILGIILAVIGYFTGIGILYTIGGILVVVGVILWILGAVGRPVGGRKVWFSPVFARVPAAPRLPVLGCGVRFRLRQYE